MRRNRTWMGMVVGIFVTLLVATLPWISLAQPSPLPAPGEPTPGPRMENFDQTRISQFARVIALVFLFQDENPQGDVEAYRQAMINACGLSPDLFNQMNYVFTGDPDFLYVVTREISKIPTEDLRC